MKKKLSIKNNFFKDNKKKILIILGIFLFVIILLKFYFYPNSSIIGKIIYEPKFRLVTEANFLETLENSEMIKDLPKSAVISLQTYRIEDGNKIYGNKITISNNKVEYKEAVNPDFIVTFNSDYISESYDLCNLAKSLYNSKDYTIEQKISKSALLFKYNRMIKYRGCIK